MKLILSLSLLCCVICSFAQNQSVGIGTTTPNASAALDVSSTDKGVLVPRMSSQQRIQISNAATGLLVFDNTTSSFWFRNATGWVELVDSTKQPWKKGGTNVYVNNGENVGIGTATPTQKLDVAGTVKATEFYATPNYGGIGIGNTFPGSSRLVGGIVGPGAGSASFFQAIESTYPGNNTYGRLILNGSGGSVGIGTFSPAAKLHVANGTALFDEGFTANDTAIFNQGFTSNGTPVFNQGLVIDGNNANNGNGINLLRFGYSTSGEGIGSKRTATGLQYGLDLYAGGSRRLSVTNTGDVTINTGTPLGRLTVNGNIVALDGNVKQKTYSWDVQNLTSFTTASYTWNHNLGYQPIIMITTQQQSGGAYGVMYSYQHIDNNNIKIRCYNNDGFFDADVILRWIVVN